LENVFEEIRHRVAMPDVAKFYGLEISHSGMACCPFHNDNTPSMKIYEDHFYCFGCGSTGDCTGFVAKLFNISQLEAAKKISYDFGLGLFTQETAVPVQIVLSPEREYQQWLQNARLSVSKYLNLLNEWRVKYKPDNSLENIHPHFEESLLQTGYTEYIDEILVYGTEKNKREFYDKNNGEIQRIQKRLEKLAAEERVPKRRAI
jgi:hypothetical protein